MGINRDRCQHSHNFRQFSSGYERCIRCGYRRKIQNPFAT